MPLTGVLLRGNDSYSIMLNGKGSDAIPDEYDAAGLLPSTGLSSRATRDQRNTESHAS